MTIILHILAIAIPVLILALIIFIATRPAAFRIERSARISGPADVVFPLINDLHRWREWSPFEKLDANMKKTFEGPATGPGAIYHWSGNARAGAGRMTIVQSNAGKLVTIKLEMFKPFACTNNVTFKLVPIDADTQVCWIMEGNNGFMGKAFSTFMSMDKMVGKEFEQGLAKMNAVAQAEVQKVV